MTATPPPAHLLEDAKALLFEFGHAMHSAGMDEASDFADRRSSAREKRSDADELAARLLAHIAEQADELRKSKVDLAHWFDMSEQRLEQMNADRRQALVWRDRVTVLEDAIRADFDPAWECISRHPKLSKIGGELVAAIASEAKG